MLLALNPEFAVQAHAQLQGTVVTASGALANASVELWTSSERIAAVLTDSAGRFSFASPQLPNAAALVVPHVGYAT